MNTPSNDRAVAAGHTPGPWVATERSGYHEILAPDATCDWYGREKMHAVAYCDTEIDEAEQLANARLIAAAPDFASVALDAVELLNRYAAFIRDHVRADDLGMHPYLPEIERVAEDLAAALSKARAGGDL